MSDLIKHILRTLIHVWLAFDVILLYDEMWIHVCPFILVALACYCKYTIINIVVNYLSFQPLMSKASAIKHCFAV